MLEKPCFEHVVASKRSKKAIERGQGSLGLKLLVPQLKVQALSWNGK